MEYQNLLNKKLLFDMLKDVRYKEGHDIDGFFCGIGLFYYAIVYALKAKLAVCLGSGSGTVPMFMRQAQRDLQIDSRTVLIDMNDKQKIHGYPDYFDNDCFFTKTYPEIEIICDKTENCFDKFDNIDYLHIDADHFFNGVKSDFDNYFPRMSSKSLITLHDTNFPKSDVGEFVNLLKQRRDLDVIDLDFFGSGLAIVKKVKSNFHLL